MTPRDAFQKAFPKDAGSEFLRLASYQLLEAGLSWGDSRAEVLSGNRVKVSDRVSCAYVIIACERGMPVVKVSSGPVQNGHVLDPGINGHG